MNDPLPGSPVGIDIQSIIKDLAYVPSLHAPELLRDAIQRKMQHAIQSDTSPEDMLALGQRLASLDIDRIIYLLGTAKTALEMIACYIVELDISIQDIEDVVQWIDIRPIGINPSYGHLGIDIVFLVGYRVLSSEQKLLLFSLSQWESSPATISYHHALAVGEAIGKMFEMNIVAEDMDRLIELGFVHRYGVAAPTDDLVSLTSLERLEWNPYVRYITTRALEDWQLPDHLPQEFDGLGLDGIIHLLLVDWALSFAKVITTTMASQAGQERMLTGSELWFAVHNEEAHLRLAIRYARELRLDEVLLMLSQTLIPVLRKMTSIESIPLREALAQESLLIARDQKNFEYIVVLATQLADVALDQKNYARAESFAEEAHDAALVWKNLKVIGFTTRRLAAILIVRGDAVRARELAEKALLLARSHGTEEEMTECLGLLDAAMKVQQS